LEDGEGKVMKIFIIYTHRLRLQGRLSQG